VSAKQSGRKTKAKHFIMPFFRFGRADLVLGAGRAGPPGAPPISLAC
jgi:hypothetical protein